MLEASQLITADVTGLALFGERMNERKFPNGKALPVVLAERATEALSSQKDPILLTFGPKLLLSLKISKYT